MTGDVTGDVTQARRRLPIETDEVHERRESRLQSAGYVLLLGFLLSAALGFSGPGWWSSRELVRGGVSVRYLRAVHSGAPAPIELELEPALVRDGRVELWFAHGWLETLELEHADPRPLESHVEPGRTVLTFAARSSGPVRIHLEGVIDGPGFVRGELGVCDGPTFELRQLAFP